MSRLHVATIVEGHGEVAALPILIRRVWTEYLKGEYVDVLRPIRQPRHRLATDKQGALTKAVGLASAKLRAQHESGVPQLIMILVDADSDLPCVLAPELLRLSKSARSDRELSCVVANVEFETWFVAGAESLVDYLDLSDVANFPEDPEGNRHGKGWIERRIKGVKYSETVDQPRLTSKLDLQLCRNRSPSFDKLCRELEKYLK